MAQGSHTKAFVILSDEETFQMAVTLRFNEFASGSHRFITGPLSEAFEYSELDQPLAVLIDLTNYEAEELPALEKICAHFYHSKLVGVGNFKDADALIQLIKLGVKDFLRFPLEAREVQTFLSQLKNLPAQSAPVKSGRIVTIFSPKGGTGVTLLTTNLAASLAQNNGQQVAICDLAPQLGDAATYLALTPEYTLRDLIDNSPRLDESFLEGVLLRHASGAKVLASPRGDQEPLNARCLTEIQTIFSLFKQTCDFLLVDAGHTDHALLQFALMQSDLIILVGNPDMPSLKGLVHTLGWLTKLQYDPMKIKVVINRYNAKNQLDTREFEKRTKHPIAGRLPNQYALCTEAINNGVTIHELQKNSGLAKSIFELAKMIQNSVAGGTPQNGREQTSDKLANPAQEQKVKRFAKWGL
ncbi:MAG: hypothetical protein A3C35_06800 [Omnitrophica bacterium RIFCSPHIGHO2_02_FULL_46_11]|nr:MAG: hypothetical protein A3C35_06800 [Omnitrophica bacterium RIFCSPHIGHO2_02_FULL_46_11]OGW86741.1 MAG: hypothetical protein A3A81_08705 [Omnitrophica bacterium RIFCSPLOWO2_01_FULL_45_10b]